MKLAALRKLCLAMPGTSEDLKWGSDVCFCVGPKIFLFTSMDGGGVTLKTEPPLFDYLVSKTGVSVARYIGKHHWVTIEDGALRRSELVSLIEESYAHVHAKLTAKLRREIEAGTGSAKAVKKKAVKKKAAKKKAAKKKVRALA